jgi:cytochrome c-type biogenesis protein CcmH
MRGLLDISAPGPPRLSGSGVAQPPHPAASLPPSPKRGEGRYFRIPALIAAAIMCMAAASDPAERLSDPAQEARARTLFAQVRCMMCQNESIDDSEAPIAHDLRMAVRRQVAEGRSNAEIRRFLVERFGQFVMLTPPLDLETAVLWGAPVVVLLGGGALLAVLLRRKIPGDGLPEDRLSDEEEARLKRILGTDKAA